jgi:hypothetical protein
MKLRYAVGLTAVLALVTPQLASSTPPSHAPAHGYRHKQATQTPAAPAAEGGIAVSFDSERGIQVAVGFPNVFFHEGHYYRERDGRWQVSVSGSGGWSISATSGVPEVVVKAKKHKHPGPAKNSGSKKSKHKKHQ